jgi:hypothetical protein
MLNLGALWNLGVSTKCYRLPSGVKGTVQRLPVHIVIQAFRSLASHLKSLGDALVASMGIVNLGVKWCTLVDVVTTELSRPKSLSTTKRYFLRCVWFLAVVSSWFEKPGCLQPITPVMARDHRPIVQ